MNYFQRLNYSSCSLAVKGPLLRQNFCLSKKWNATERKSPRRLLPVVWVSLEYYHQRGASFGWTCCCKTTSLLWIFSTSWGHICLNCFYLTIANKNLKNSSLYVPTITKLSQNHHLSLHTLHKQVKQMFATRHPEKTPLGIEKFRWKAFSGKLACDEIIYELRWQLCFAVNFN